MPLARWFARIPKHLFNSREIRKGVRPVLHHVGRTSGREYQTPLDALPVNGGYLFVLVYGAESDWVQNILRSGTARLRVAGTMVELDSPRLVDRSTADELVGPDAKLPPGFMNVGDYLRMSVAG